MRNLILGISVIALTGCSTGDVKVLATVFTGHNFLSEPIPPQNYNVTKVSSSKGTCQTWIPAMLQDYTQTKITNVTWTGGCDKELYKGGELEGYGTLSGFDKNKQLVFQLKGFARSYGSTNIFTSFEFDFLGVKIKYRDKYISEIFFNPGEKQSKSIFTIKDAIEYKAQKQVYVGNYTGSNSSPNQPKQLNKDGVWSEELRQKLKTISVNSANKIEEIEARAAQREKEVSEEKQARRQEQWQQLGQVLGAAATGYVGYQAAKQGGSSPVNLPSQKIDSLNSIGKKYYTKTEIEKMYLNKCGAKIDAWYDAQVAYFNKNRYTNHLPNKNVFYREEKDYMLGFSNSTDHGGGLGIRGELHDGTGRYYNEPRYYPDKTGKAWEGRSYEKFIKDQRFYLQEAEKQASTVPNTNDDTYKVSWKTAGLAKACSYKFILSFWGES